jgi:folate-binding protein YgfZ
MPVARLDNRALIAVRGPEAAHFLQNILTVDLEALKAGEVLPGALLQPQGKILFDFLISRDGVDGFILECRADTAADFQRRLMLYKLRAKAEISQQDQPLVLVSWQNDSASSQSDSTSSALSGGLIDRRFSEPARVIRFYGDGPAPDGTQADWHAFRIAQGVPESGADYALGEAFPHDVLLDQLAGVGFAKGCYIGQEVVSRMQHRGTARRRVLIASAEAPLPAPGTEVTAGGRAIGTLGSVAGRTGLALVRIDRAGEAMDAGVPIMAGEVAISLSIPAFARFGFPEITGETDR